MVRDGDDDDSTRSWTVKHRFSEFVELHRMLQKRFKECDFPSIRSSSQNPEHRRDRLAAFLDYVSSFEEFLKSDELCAFITSDEHLVASSHHVPTKINKLIAKLVRA